MARAFLGHLRELATNVYGCRVIQKMFELLPEGMKVDLLEEMHPMCEELMQNQFGSQLATAPTFYSQLMIRLRGAECLGGRERQRPKTYNRSN